ncbi:MAG: SLC13 family permease [Pseudoclavibacter sp.]
MDVIKKILNDRILQISFLVFSFLSIISRPNLSDINWNTIFSLFSLMLLVKCFDYLNVLNYFVFVLLKKFDNTRTVSQMIVFFSFFSSMLLTNDVAILTLVPLVFLIRKRIDINTIFLVTLVNIAANLGSSVTPIGNPQNIFILNFYHLSFFSFFKMSFLVGILSILLLFFFSLKFKKEDIKIYELSSPKINFKKIIILIIFSFFILLSFFSIISKWIMILFSIIAVLITNKQLLKKIDYSILITFVLFFLAVGSFSRINMVNNFFSSFIHSDFSVYLISLFSSQIISNVPAAVLVSKFTGRVYPLFLGVSIGGLGSLVASLANLLAYKEYRKNKKDRYLSIFLKINFIFLMILGIVFYLLFKLG